MSDAVIVGLITAGATILCQFIISHSKSRETDSKMAAHEQKQEDGLIKVTEELSEVKSRLDKHNGYAEKFAENSKNLAVLSEKQEHMSKAISNIQKDIDYLKSDRCQL